MLYHAAHSVGYEIVFSPNCSSNKSFLGNLKNALLSFEIEEIMCLSLDMEIWGLDSSSRVTKPPEENNKFPCESQ